MKAFWTRNKNIWGNFLLVLVPSRSVMSDSLRPVTEGIQLMVGDKPIADNMDGIYFLDESF